MHSCTMNLTACLNQRTTRGGKRGRCRGRRRANLTRKWTLHSPMGLFRRYASLLKVWMCVATPWIICLNQRTRAGRPSRRRTKRRAYLTKEQTSRPGKTLHYPIAFSAWLPLRLFLLQTWELLSLPEHQYQQAFRPSRHLPKMKPLRVSWPITQVGGTTVVGRAACSICSYYS